MSTLTRHQARTPNRPRDASTTPACISRLHSRIHNTACMQYLCEIRLSPISDRSLLFLHVLVSVLILRETCKKPSPVARAHHSTPGRLGPICHRQRRISVRSVPCRLRHGNRRNPCGRHHSAGDQPDGFPPAEGNPATRCCAANNKLQPTPVSESSGTR